MSPTATEKKTAKTPARKGPTTVVRAYFTALAERDWDAVTELWEPGAIDRIVGMEELRAPQGIIDWFSNLYEAIPDFSLELVSVTTQKETVAVRWRGGGSFDGTAKFQGVSPTGTTIDIEGCDIFTVVDGKITENHAYTNGAEIARQMGMLPPAGSAAERAMLAAGNAKTRGAALVKDLRARRGA